MDSEEKKGPVEVLTLLDQRQEPKATPKKENKEQVEIFPEFYAILEDIRDRLDRIEVLLKQKVDLDVQKQRLLDLLQRELPQS